MIKDSHGRDIAIELKGKSALADDGRLRLTDIDFSRLDLMNATISDVIFDCCTFAELRAIGLTVKNVDFDGGSLADSDFSGARFTDVSFYAVEALDAIFDRARFANSNFLGCNLEYTSFRSAAFEHLRIAVDKIGCVTTIVGADFSNAIMSGVSFEGAEYDDGTVFPNAFDATRIRGLIRRQA